MVIRAPRDLAVIVAEKQYGHALTFTLATHPPCATGPRVINCDRPAISLSFLSLPPLYLPFGMHDVGWPVGRGMQGPGVKFSRRASASGSGKIHKPTGPQQRGGRRLAGSGLAGHNRMTRRHNMFAPSRRIGGVTTANGAVTVGQSRKVEPEPQP